MTEVTKMKLKVVNLGCKRCYKKIKKLLFKFPEIRDQTFIEKEDTVIIKVVCSYPEMIRTKLFYKGSDTIKSIEVIPHEKPPPPPPPRPRPPTPVRTPVPEYPEFIYPIGVYCKSCYGGRDGGPYHHGYGIQHQPPSYNEYVRPVPSYDGWASGCRCDRSYGCRSEFDIEENPTCTIM